MILLVPVFLFLVIIFITGYVKASPDEAVIISGLKAEPKVVTGKAAVKIPFLERKDRLTLKAIKIDVKTQKSVPTNEFIDVFADSVVTVKISRDPELIKLAAQNFLNQPESHIVEMVTDVLEGNIREIIGTMTLKEMISNRQVFGKRVEENAAPDMKKMGIEIISFNIQNFWDEKGIIDDLGVENTSKVKMAAEITRADAEKNVKIARAQSNKFANDEEVKSKREIAEKQHELDIKTAELKQSADTQRAQADSAYKIQEETQRKEIELAKANADLARQEKLIELKEREVQIQERMLEAEIKKTAEANKYASQQKAEAELFERKKRAEAEIEEAKAKRVAREEEAIGLKAVAMAEAEGIRAKGLAEAEGVDKLADAQAKMGQAAILGQYFEVLPEIAKNVAKPLENVNSITMYGEGNNSKMIEDITKATSQISSGLNNGLGIDIKSMLAGFMGGKMAVPGEKNNESINAETVNTLAEKFLSQETANQETTDSIEVESIVEIAQSTKEAEKTPKETSKKAKDKSKE